MAEYLNILVFCSSLFYFMKAMPAESEFLCPCCERDLSKEADIKRFQKAMKSLSAENSVLIKVDERTKVAKVRQIRLPHRLFRFLFFFSNCGGFIIYLFILETRPSTKNGKILSRELSVIFWNISVSKKSWKNWKEMPVTWILFCATARMSVIRQKHSSKVLRGK